jgi:hypothetical protein
VKHPSEEQLIAYQQSEPEERDAIRTHVSECSQCRAALEKIEGVLAAFGTMTAPEPEEGFERRMWQGIAARLPEKAGSRWKFWRRNEGAGYWWDARRLAAMGTLAAMLVIAFVAGRITRDGGKPPSLNAEERTRERVLWMAVGEHLGRAEVMLVELSNAEPQSARVKQVNLASEERRAEELLDENRLYRQTAKQEGDESLVSLLDELERVLLDVAHSPQEVSTAQLTQMQERIESQNILFKVRVVSQELRQRQKESNSGGAGSGSNEKERKKA